LIAALNQHAVVVLMCLITEPITLKW